MATFNVGDRVQLRDGRKGVVAAVHPGSTYALTLEPGPLPTPGPTPTQPTDAVPENFLTKLEEPASPAPAPTNPGVLSLQVGDRVRLLDGRTGVVARVNVDGTNFAVTIDQPGQGGEPKVPSAKDTATDSVPAGFLTKLPSDPAPAPQQVEAPGDNLTAFRTPDAQRAADVQRAAERGPEASRERAVERPADTRAERAADAKTVADATEGHTPVRDSGKKK